VEALCLLEEALNQTKIWPEARFDTRRLSMGLRRLGLPITRRRGVTIKERRVNT